MMQRGEPAGFLIHLEHQAQPDTNLPRRMLEYFTLDVLLLLPAAERSRGFEIEAGNR
jgi:hypothetical protein